MKIKAFSASFTPGTTPAAERDGWVRSVSILRAVKAKHVTPGHEAGENQKNLVQQQIFHGHEKLKWSRIARGKNKNERLFVWEKIYLLSE
jgi:hypothetical protein